MKEYKIKITQFPRNKRWSIQNEVYFGLNSSQEAWLDLVFVEYYKAKYNAHLRIHPKHLLTSTYAANNASNRDLHAILGSGTALCDIYDPANEICRNPEDAIIEMLDSHYRQQRKKK